MRKLLVLLVAICMIMPTIWISENEMAKAEESKERSEGLDYDFIWNVTYQLSNIIFQYPPDEIEKGREFGSWGESYAANKTKNWMQNTIGLSNVHKERIAGEISEGIHDYYLEWKRNIQPSWYLEVTATNGKNRETRNMTCFPYLSYHKFNKTWGPDTKPVAIAGSKAEDTIENKSLYIWLYDVEEEDPYNWIDWESARYRHFITMDCNDDTYFMTQLKPYSSLGFNYPGFGINKTEGNWIKDKINNSWDVEATFYQSHTWEEIDSYNIMGDVPAGPGGNDSKIVVIGAHYDSWWGQCAIDNAAGAATMLGVAKYFKENSIQPKYRLRFVAFGGEEWPPYSRGAKHYVNLGHPDENDDIVMMINLDQLAHNTLGSELRIYSDKDNIENTVYDIAKYLIDYENRTDYTLEIAQEDNGEADDMVFDEFTDIVSFFKEMETNWYFPMYHRDDGTTHQQGDVLSNVDRNDLNVTAQVALATVLYYCVNDSHRPESSVNSFSYWHTSSPITVTASAWDNETATSGKTGVCKMRLEYHYRPLNGSKDTYWRQFGEALYRSPWQWSFNFPNGTGFYQLRTIATDYSGNEESANPSDYDVEIGYDTGNPTIIDHQSGDNTWRNSNSGRYDVDFNDSPSGLDKIEVRKSGDVWRLLEDLNGEESYTNNWTLPSQVWNDLEQGINYIDVKAEDMAGNQNTGANVFYVKKDTINPVISNIAANPTMEGTDGYVNITCTVTDSTSGVATVNAIITYPNESEINVTMSHTGSNGYYYYDEYSIPGEYSYRIWAKDNAGNQKTSESTTFYIIRHNFTLYDGWNLVTVPVENSYTASDLATCIPGCTQVAWLNAESGSYSTFLVNITPPDSPWDFNISDGVGYYISVANDTNFTLIGVPLSAVSVPLYVGWNAIGWWNETSTNASSLAAGITECKQVAMWDASSGTYTTFLVGITPPGSPWDFAITRGMGILVDVNTSSTWHGETGNSGGKGGGEGNGSGDDIPPFPYSVAGYAYYGETPADGANVTLTNRRTEESLYGEVGSYGYYCIDLNEMTWEDGDELTITVTGTGEYEGWSGRKIVTADTDVTYIHVDDIILQRA